MKGTEAPTYPIESVDRALTLIQVFEHADSVTINEASALLEVSRSTAFRLLRLLEHREFVHQDPRTKAFYGGSALLRVGLAAVHRSDLRSATRPLLEAIVRAVDETAHLVVLQGSQAFFLDVVEGSKMIRASSRVGAVLPAHTTSGGKILLAELPDQRLESRLTDPLPGLTRHSKVSAASVREEIEKIREQGWALNDRESEEDLRAAAVLVPASTDRGGVDAAVSVSGPAQRMTKPRIRKIVRSMQEQVAEFVGPALD